MKILVVGDTHGNNEVLKDLLKEYPNMDKYIHVGDSCSYPEELYPFISVMGNCDFYPFDEKLLIRTAKGKILFKHLPYFTSEERKSADILVHGHTHIYKMIWDDDKLVLCPGSISRPRDGSDGTFMIIDITESKISIDIIDTFSKSILLSY